MRLFLAAFFILVFQAANAQLQLPTFDFDDVQVFSEEDNVYQKVFRKGDETVLEIHYPHKGSIHSLCYKSNVVADSVYIFHVPVLKEISLR